MLLVELSMPAAKLIQHILGGSDKRSHGISQPQETTGHSQGEVGPTMLCLDELSCLVIYEERGGSMVAILGQPRADEKGKIAEVKKKIGHFWCLKGLELLTACNQKTNGCQGGSLGDRAATYVGILLANNMPGHIL